MWFYENLHSDIKLAIKGNLLHKKKTAYQTCRIYQTKDFGRLFLLDDAIQTTEADEYIYHEMLVHPCLLTHPSPKKILVIGGGDGGVIREVFKYPVEEVIMVEIDKDVIELSKKYLPAISKGAFFDKRLVLIIGDGAKYVNETSKKFDLVIVDSPDPVGPANVLFSQKFYQSIFKILKTDGIMARQTGSSFLQKQILESNWRRVKKVFPKAAVRLIAVPTYIGGFFTLLNASKRIDLLKDKEAKIKQKYLKLGLKTKYYNPEIHNASLKLPNQLKTILK